jgi:hypothetical protein
MGLNAIWSSWVAACMTARTMDFRERALYHQIHPLKLLTDWSSGFGAAYLLWQHRLVAGLVLGLIPPLVVSVLLMRWADLERYKISRFGRYVACYMTRSMELLRLAGAVLLWVGAWYHIPLLLVGGVAVVLVAWARGKLWPGSPPDAAA